jgi:hypothetical protein
MLYSFPISKLTMDEIRESDMNKKTELNNNCRNSIKG